jgi:hypothetical protein
MLKRTCQRGNGFKVGRIALSQSDCNGLQDVHVSGCTEGMKGKLSISDLLRCRRRRPM